jgi:hypothetical protein
MFRTIFASVWTLTTVAALLLGLNGRIDPAAMVIFSLVALGLFYAFALFTVFVNLRESQLQNFKTVTNQ